MSTRQTLVHDTIAAITNLAASSAIAKYNWPGRGVAPAGYVQGMAVDYGKIYWNHGHPQGNYHAAAVGMAQANTGLAETDALSWYAGFFTELGMDNSVDGVATLRHLYVLLMGLGMRESSGKYCEGRDMSASNVAADTAEAGLFQTSWNIHTASPEIPRLFELYAAGADGYRDIFSLGVTCSSANWSNYGSGKGRDFQEMSKMAPTFAVEVAAVGLRKRRKHWGPINRYEAQLVPASDDLFAKVEAIVDEAVAQEMAASAVPAPDRKSDSAPKPAAPRPKASRQSRRK